MLVTLILLHSLIYFSLFYKVLQTSLSTFLFSYSSSAISNPLYLTTPYLPSYTLLFSSYFYLYIILFLFVIFSILFSPSYVFLLFSLQTPPLSYAFPFFLSQSPSIVLNDNLVTLYTLLLKANFAIANHSDQLLCLWLMYILKYYSNS